MKKRAKAGRNWAKYLVSSSRGNGAAGINKGNGSARPEPLEFDITWQWIEQQFEKQDRRCFYTRYPINPYSCFDTGNRLAISVDRVNSKKGYTMDNVVLTCSYVNIGLGSVDPEEKWRIINIMHPPEVVKQFEQMETWGGARLVL
tara:strand:+ start:66 stop:500 length:435 start_codon:yes stop_codon:yes gene_type:complete